VVLVGPAGLGRGLAVGRAAPDLPLRGPVDRDRDLDLAVLVDRVARGLAVPDLPLRGPVDRDRDLDLVDRVARGLAVPDLALRHLAVLVGQADLGTVDLGDRRLVDRHRVDRVDRVDPGTVDLGDQDLAGLPDRVGLVGRADPGTVDLADRVGLVGRADPGTVDLADRVDPHPRRTRPGALSIEAAHKWADLRTRRTGSAHPTTVRLLRRGNTDSGGTAGLLPERRRQTGTVRRLPVVGTVRRLRVVGTVHGTGRRVTSVPRRPISDRSTTPATTRSRSSTRYSVDGASGSSEPGFRCTDTTSTLVASGLL
jgi:hypothetical protein